MIPAKLAQFDKRCDDYFACESRDKSRTSTIETRMVVSRGERAEQRLRTCRDGRGLGSKLVSFAKGVSKHSYILAIFKVDSEYLRFPSKVKLDYIIFYSTLVSISVIFHPFFAMNKRRCTDKAENSLSFECVHFQA